MSRAPRPAGRGPGLDQLAPDAGSGVFGSDVQLEAVLARVAGAGDDGRGTVYLTFDKAEGFDAKRGLRP